MLLYEQVILVRDDEARQQVPPSLSESAIVLTIFEAKGLEFNDVLLWNFFSDSPAEKEWRCLIDYWDNQASEPQSGGTSIASNGGGGEVRAESFETMDGRSGVKMRPLKFEEGRYALLESELKALYCALTRARINVWIVDFDQQKRSPAYYWFSNAGLVDVVSKDSAVSLSTTSGGATKSSPKDFQKRGLYFQEMAFTHEKPEGLLEAAITCFRQAGAEDLMIVARAEIAAVSVSCVYGRVVHPRDNEMIHLFVLSLFSHHSIIIA